MCEDVAVSVLEVDGNLADPCCNVCKSLQFLYFVPHLPCRDKIFHQTQRCYKRCESTGPNVYLARPTLTLSDQSITRTFH